MKYLILNLFCLFTLSNLNAQITYDLWNESYPPTDNQLTGAETIDNGQIANISKSQIIVYRPDSLTNHHIAVIICPGEQYSRLSIEQEGYKFAEWLQSQGITAIVLKYRSPNKHKEVPLEDFEQAMRFVKTKTKDWSIADNKIGVAGFSAGGHLAARASTYPLDENLRPNFSILFYPLITMGENTHIESKDNLLGENSSAKDALSYSVEMNVTELNPATLIILSDDDPVISPKNSLMYYDALKNHNVPASMYIFPSGGHAWGMNPSFKYHQQMLSLIKHWLDQFN